MKGNHLFIFFIVLFLGVMFAIEYNMPKQFVWNPTFSRYDKQPFGCALFDSLLVSSLPSGYSISKKSFYQLEQEDTTRNRGILVIGKELNLTNVDVEALLQMAERGDKVMLVGNWFGKKLEDTLKCHISGYYFSPVTLKKYASSLLARDSIRWVGDSATYPRRNFYFYPQLCGPYFWSNDSLPMNVLAEKADFLSKVRAEANSDSLASSPDSIYYNPVAISYSRGRGEVILVSTPLIFTNYGVLDGRNADYVFRLLSQMKNLPIVRTEAYTKGMEQEEQSPFRYFLSQRPLRWALYLTMFTILLFMLFTARRRQRAIPVVHEPDNKSLEFTELIGTLYYQKKDHADLVRKKFTYFAEELRREIQVDIEDAADDERSFYRIAQKTGMDMEELKHFIHDVRPVATGKYEVSDEEMKQYIDKMNEIINQL